jgi:L-ascorbate metabolism protein UlaG (beta-lactamase superfamily)
MIENIKWLGHGSFLIEGPPFIYIDPWRVVRSAFLADIILISHDHYDHCSLVDVEKLRSEDTRIVTNQTIASQIPDAHILRPWQTISMDRVAIKAIPAYSPKSSLHPSQAGGLGFVVSLRMYDIYYAGDTGMIPEMNLIHPDIALLPIDNNGTMSVEEAAQAVEIMKPRWVIPYNWGSSSSAATLADALEFKRLVNNITQVILPATRSTQV